MLKYIAALNIILNILLCYYFKESGIAIATDLTFLVIFVLSIILIIKNTDLKINNLIFNYLKGIIFFSLCFLINYFFTFNSPITAIIFSTICYIILNMMILFSKDDWRIAMEIIGKK